jgi:hypothetical protein
VNILAKNLFSSSAISASSVAVVPSSLSRGPTGSRDLVRCFM